jgi:hypothetical protein
MAITVLAPSPGAVVQAQGSNTTYTADAYGLIANVKLVDLRDLVAADCAANSNTQTTTSNGAIAGATHEGLVPPLDATAVENAAILIAVTINNTTTTTDASICWLEVNAMN